MKNKYGFVASLLLGILVFSFGLTNLYVMENYEDTDDDFVVVTSFYPMYIAAMNLTQDAEGVTLKNLSEPQTGCLHDFQLTPEDMKLLSKADVFLINGGGIESFMEEIAVQYPQLTVIEAVEGMELLGTEADHDHAHDENDIEHEEHDEEHGHDHDHEHGEANAHAWMSVTLYRRQVKTMAEGLAKADPANAAVYLANAEEYDGKLSKLQEQQEEIRQLAQGQEVILFHGAYEYIAKDLGMEAVLSMDLDEERQVSAGEVAEVLSRIQKEGVRLLLAEELYGSSMCEMIQKEAQVTVLYLDPLTRGEYESDAYLKQMEKNLELLREAIVTTK